MSETISIPIDEYENLKKDAERYRWLRQPLNINTVNYMSDDEYDYNNYTHDGDALDEAIDKEMSK